MAVRKSIAVHDSGFNVFADLGLPEAGPHFLKAQIVAELIRLTNERELTQAEAGAVMGISQSEISRLFRGHFREYSVERLLDFLTTFDQDVLIISRPREGADGRAHGQIVFKPVSA